MSRKFFHLNNISSFSLIDIDKRASTALQNHFGLSNYQMLVISWFKGVWTGILFSLILHYFIDH